MKMYRFITSLFLLSVACSEALAQLTLNASDGLPDLGRSSSVWADFNNDGHLDVALSGINASGNKQAGIYLNTNNGSFSNSGVALEALSDGDMAVHDYNKDGKIDLLLTGIDANNVKVSKLYKNEGGAVFNALPLSLEGLGYGGCAFHDLNNDGHPDILLNGLNALNQNQTLLYKNNGNETFTLLLTSLTSTAYGDVLIFDMNGDSFLDVLISGLNTNNQRVMELYINKGSFSFVKKPTVLPALRSGSMSSADLNNDGYPDLFISGSSSGSANHTAIYLNNAGNGFTLFQNLPALSDGAGVWGDYNNDGWVDLLFFGFDKTDLKTLVYNNTNGTALVDAQIPLPAASQGTVHWIDYNNDKRLDLHLSGYSSIPFTSLYHNTATAANTLPTAPANLKATAYADSVILSWDPAQDQETASSGLTYAIYIGSAAGTADIVRPLSVLTNGFRKIAGAGVLHQTHIVVPKLPEGTYYWSVQTIDAAHGASAFSPEAVMVSCAPVVISGDDKVCQHASLTLQAGMQQDQVTWYSKAKNNQAIGTGWQLNYSLSAKDTILTKIEKPLGCILYDTLPVDVWTLPALHAGEDKKNCFSKEVELTAVTSLSPVQWFEADHEAQILFAGNTIHVSVTRDLHLVARVKDDHGCQATDTVQIGLYPQPVVDLGADQMLCDGSMLLLSAGSPDDSVNWYTQQKGLLSKDQFDVSIKVQQAELVWAEVFNEEGCVSYDTVSVGVYALPLAHAGEDKMTCGQDAVSIGDSPSASGLTFLWQPAQSLNASDISNPIASPQQDTRYILWIKDQHDCENSDTVWVYLNPATVIDVGPERSVCTGSSVMLGGEPTAKGSNLPYSFQWSPSTGLNEPMSANPTASPVETTTYTLQVFAGNCTAGSKEVKVVVNALPLVRANEDVTIGAAQSVSLSAEGADSYEWFPQELFSDPTSSQPLVSPNRTTAYRVIGKDLNGCLNSDTVTVTVRSELFVPGLFTPNDDAVNAVFRAHGFGVKTITLKVFDRWGRLLFSSDNLEEGWDGHFNGQPVESGNYVWTVEGEFFDGEALHYRGQQRGIIKLLR